MTDQKKSQLEFIAMMACLMSLVALSIDAILPGIGQIGESIQNHNSTDLQMIITMMFVGLGFGQLIFGSISDSIGRKPAVYMGVVVFLIGSIICVSSQSLTYMLLGRVIQGFGLSAPRSISTSIIRDSYSGDYMARIMSFITVIFILVPMLAPIIGQVILHYSGWRAIFYFQAVFGLFVILWFALRQKETLQEENKVKLSRYLFIDGIKEFFKHKESVYYTLISGFMTGGFMVYLSASKQIFQDQYGLVSQFVYIFGGIAFFMGLATFLNGSLVLRYGMKKLSTTALIVFTCLAFIYTLVFFNVANPRIEILLLFMGLQFICIGFIFGNVRAITMQPIGHIAGIGASFSGFTSTLMAVPVAMWIGKYIDQTAWPMFVGFFICGLLSLGLIYLVRTKAIKGRS